MKTDDNAAISGVQIFLNAGLDKESDATSGVAALVAECLIRTPVSAGGESLPLRDAIMAQGGSVQYTVDGSSVHFYVEGRSDKLPALVALLSRAFAAPDFFLSPATSAAARRSLGTRIGELAGERAVGRHRDVPGTRTTQPTPASRRSARPPRSPLISGRDLTAFYQQNYKRSGLTFSAVGKTGPALSEALTGFAAALPEGAVATVPPKARPIPATAPRIVARRDVGAPIIVVGYAAPAPGSRDFGAMVVLGNRCSRNAFERSSSTTLGLAGAVPVGAFDDLDDSAPASLVVYVNGTRVDPEFGAARVAPGVEIAGRAPALGFGAQAFQDASVRSVRDGLGDDFRSCLSARDLCGARNGARRDQCRTRGPSTKPRRPTSSASPSSILQQRYIVALVSPRQNG